jgi:hypothetical protein
MILYIIIWFLVIGLSCLCLFKVLPEIVVFWMFSVQLSFLELLGVIFFFCLCPMECANLISRFTCLCVICGIHYHTSTSLLLPSLGWVGQTSRGPRAISRGARAGPSNSPVCYFINQLVGCVRFVTYIIFCCPWKVLCRWVQYLAIGM